MAPHSWWNISSGVSLILFLRLCVLGVGGGSQFCLLCLASCKGVTSSSYTSLVLTSYLKVLRNTNFTLVRTTFILSPMASSVMPSKVLLCCTKPELTYFFYIVKVTVTSNPYPQMHFFIWSFVTPYIQSFSGNSRL